MIKRLTPNSCIGIIVDVQDYFLTSLAPKERERIEKTTAHFVRLFDYLDLPLVFTLERPLERKGKVPKTITDSLSGKRSALSLEKNFFALTGENEIVEKLAALKHKQIVLTGCETDVCILQSCLGLLELGYEVYVVEDLLFSSSAQIQSAIERMKIAGATFLTYKTLYYELLAAVKSSPHHQEMVKTFGPFPKELADFEFCFPKSYSI